METADRKGTREPHARAMLENLKRAGLRLTPQRIAIVKLFAADRTHPTAQELFERVRAEFPQVSFATVYNTLDALANAGLSGIVRLGNNANAARFDPNTEAHHHAVCDVCGAVIDVPAGSLSPRSPRSQTMMRVARAVPGFSVRAIERVYRGVCSSCSRVADEEKRPRKKST